MGCRPHAFKEEVTTVQKQEIVHPHGHEVPTLTVVNVPLSKVNDGAAMVTHH